MNILTKYGLPLILILALSKGAFSQENERALHDSVKVQETPLSNGPDYASEKGERIFKQTASQIAFRQLNPEQENYRYKVQVYDSVKNKFVWQTYMDFPLVLDSASFQVQSIETYSGDSLIHVQNFEVYLPPEEAQESNRIESLIDSLNPFAQRDTNKKIKLSLPVEGEISYLNTYSADPVPGMGYYKPFGNQVALRVKTAELGIPVIASVSYSDYLTTSPWVFNISYDTAAANEKAAGLAFDSPDLFKDSLMRSALALQEETDSLEWEKQNIVNEYDTSHYGSSEFMSTSEDSTQRYASTDPDADYLDGMSRKDQKKVRQINEQIDANNTQYGQQLNLIKNDSALNEVYQQNQPNTDAYSTDAYATDQVGGSYQNQAQGYQQTGENLSQTDVNNTGYEDLFQTDQQKLLSSLTKRIKFLEIGRIYPRISELTTKDYSLNGFQAGIALGKKVMLQGFHGKTPESYMQSMKSTGLALSAEPVDFFQLKLTGVQNRGQEQENAENWVSPTAIPNNSVVSVETQLKIKKFVKFTAEMALSETSFETADQNRYFLPGFTEADERLAFALGLELSPSKSTVLKTTWKRSGEDFRAYSSPYFLSHSDEFRSRLKQSLFNRKLTLTARYEYAEKKPHENVQNTRQMLLVKLATKFRKFPNFFAVVSPLENRMESQFNGLLSSNHYQMLTLTGGMHYRFRIQQVSAFVMGTYNYSRAELSTSETTTEFKSLSTNLMLSYKKVSWNGSYIYNQSASIITQQINSEFTVRFDKITCSLLNGYNHNSIQAIYRNFLKFGYHFSKIKTKLTLSGGFHSYSNKHVFQSTTNLVYSF